jgi:DNA-binding response OmpR family regulator
MGKVLLLDDDDLCHQKMSLAFDALQSNIELRKAKTVQAALEILNTERVDALFLDRDLGKDENAGS